MDECGFWSDNDATNFSSALAQPSVLKNETFTKLQSIFYSASYLRYLILQYLGFCPWKLVETQGGLIPGNPSMGIVKYTTMYFVFSCPEAFTDFSKEPDE